MNLESSIALIMGRRWLTILLPLLVMLALAAGARHIEMVDVDVRNHFGKDDPHIVALKQLEDTYALSDAALIAVAPQSGTVFTRDTLIAIEDLTDQLWRTPMSPALIQSRTTRIAKASRTNWSSSHSSTMPAP